MQLKSLLPAALACAAGASAFLLPPDVSGEALEALSSPAVSSDNHWTVDLETGDAPLTLDFTQTEREVLLNGVPVYPPQPVPQVITIKQEQEQPDDAPRFIGQDVEYKDVPISTRMDYSDKVEIGSDLTLRQFRMEILGVADKVVHADTVLLEIVEADEGQRIHVAKLLTLPTTPSPADQACTTVLCRMRAQIAEKLGALKAKVGGLAKGCASKMGFGGRPHKGHGGHRRPGPHNTGDDKNVLDHIKGGPNKFAGKFGKKPCPGKMGMGKHGHRHHHHGMVGKIAHVAMNIVRHVMLPILVGVAAGMAVSAFGMLVGQIVFMVWMRLRGRKNGSYVALYQVVENEDVEQGLDEEDLPKYEEKEGALPAYEEKKKDEVQK